MKPHWNWKSKGIALVVAGALGACCLATGCQATPAEEAVVNERQSIPEDALIGESQSADPEATLAPAASYAPTEHWSETLHPGDGFTVIADTDILMPDVETYPVEKIEQRELSQELVDKLIDYLAPGAEFRAAAQQKTKSEWEQDILNMRETLATDQANGDEDAVAQDQETLDEWTRLYEAAPETAEAARATTEYTYSMDYVTGEPLTELGPNYINIVTEDENGNVKQFDAHRRDDSDPMQFPYFSYVSTNYQTQDMDLYNQESLVTERADCEALEEPYRSEELERLNQLEALLAARVPLYDESPIDLQTAKEQARKILGDLGMGGMQPISAVKALTSPYKGEHSEGDSPEAEDALTDHAVYLELRRTSGGLPCMYQTYQAGEPDASEQYSAPFMPESGAMLLDKDGNVLCLQWDGPSEVVEIVAPDSDLIPVETAKERVVELLYRNALKESPDLIAEQGLEYEIEEMRLVMGYVNAKDDPDRALAVPAWYVCAKGRQASLPDGGMSYYSDTQVMINALDGAPILMPGTVQSSGGTAE